MAAAAPAAPTDLPAAQAISPAVSIPAARNDSRKKENAAPSTSRVVIIDPQTNTVVFRSLDVDTGRVVDQVPAQALLRQRAYVGAQGVQALIAGKNPTAAMLAAMQNVDTTT
jgi:flagellar protein FlaG